MSAYGRVVAVSLELEYELRAARPKLFRKEFDKLSELEDDAIGQWLKMAKARGETKESDTVLINLIMELHRKVDSLTNIVKNEDRVLEALSKKTPVTGLGHGFFQSEGAAFEVGREYYGRIDLAVFPTRTMGFYFEAKEQDICMIKLMHERDIRDWDSYVAARERTLIRERKGLGGI